MNFYLFNFFGQKQDVHYSKLMEITVQGINTFGIAETGLEKAEHAI